MVYESDFYTVRRPYTRPTITSYSVTGWRPCLSIRGVIAPPGTHSKVRMSILLGELNRIQHRHRPHLAYVPTEDFLCSRQLVDFDDEAKYIRAQADKLIRYCHTSVPHETTSPRVITAYDRYAPQGRYVSKYSNDIPANIQCMSYYTEPSRVTIGRGHLACMSYAGGRGYPKRKHLYTDEMRDIGDEIKFRSYYSKNVHPSRNDDALLLPTGFASRILLPDRRLLPSDEGRALVFQSKLLKPTSSSMSLKKEKPEKKPAPKQKTKAQAIEDAILAEESAKMAAYKPSPPREPTPPSAVSASQSEPEPEVVQEPEVEVESEPEPQVVQEVEPEPLREPTPPPPEKIAPKKEAKKKTSLKSSTSLIETKPTQEVEAAPEVEPAVEVPSAAAELEAVDELQPSERITSPEPVAEPVIDSIAEQVAEPIAETTITPEASSEDKGEIVDEASSDTVAEPIPEPVETQPEISQEPECNSGTELERPASEDVVVDETPANINASDSDVEPPVQPEVTAEKSEEPVELTEAVQETEAANITGNETEEAATTEEPRATTEVESSAAEQTDIAAAPQEEPVTTEEPPEQIEDDQSKIVLSEEIIPTETVESTAETTNEETAETPLQETNNCIPQENSEITEVVEISGNVTEAAEPIIEEPTTPVAE